MSYNYSLIIPHYDSFEMLLELLSSVPERNDIQLIVIDDNSYEDKELFGKKLREACKREMEIGLNPSPKHSAGACRNEGLKLAKGKWLIFADADDRFTDGAFDIMDRYLDCDADVVYFIPSSVRLPELTEGSRHKKYEKMIREYLDSGRTEYMLRYHLHAPWSKMIRTELVKEKGIRFDEVRYSNDVMFSVKCGFYGKKIAASDEVVYRVSQRAGTLTSNKSVREYRGRFDVFVDKYLFLKESLDKKEFRRVAEWPGGKILRAVKLGYGLPMVRYILKEYRKHGIRIGLPSRNYFRDIV